MISRILSSIALASLCAAAEDLVIMRDGSRLVGDIQADDARQVVLRIDKGMLVTLDRIQVDKVVPGGGRGLDLSGQAIEAEQPGDARRRRAPWVPADHRWTIGLALTAGWTSGSAEGSGTVEDTVAGNTFPLEGTYDLGGMQLPAGAVIRLTRDAAPAAAGLRLGLQAGYADSSSDEAGCSQLQVAALAGWSWGDASRRHAVQGLLGWGTGSFDRELTLVDPSGTTLAEIDDSADLSGFILGVEAETAWVEGRWVLGLLAGVSWSMLDGDASWTDGSGQYAGSESLEAAVMTLYAGGFIGLRL